MEPLFDKDIDAILRASRGSIATPTPAAAHADADAMAAFVENALPDQARKFYLAHFADCDDCRQKLALAIGSRAPDQVADAVAAELPAAVSKLPWYSGLLRSPGFAAAFGVLVIGFAATAAYLVLQDRQSESNATVSQVFEPENMANSDANVAPALPAASETNVASANNGPSAGRPGMPANAGPQNTQGDIAFGTGSGAGRGSASPPPAEAVTTGEASQPPQPLAAAPMRANDDARVAAEERTREDEKAIALSKRKEAEDRTLRRDQPPAAKQGPTASGPAQVQSNQTTLDSVQAPQRRTAGRKTFENVDGVWRDTAYRGQATTNLRRGSEDYKKLDSGLRSIADQLTGTIIVVWKEKAYRIQ